MTARIRFLSCAAPPSAGIRRPFESALLRTMCGDFLARLSAALAERLRGDIVIRVMRSAERCDSTDGRVFAFRVFQSRLTLRLPAALIGIVSARALGRTVWEFPGEPSDDDIATIRELAYEIVRSELLNRHRVLIESVGEPSEPEHPNVLPLEIETADGIYPAAATFDDAFLDRARAYARADAAALLQHTPGHSVWKLVARRELDSFEMLSRLAPGMKLRLSQFLLSRSELVQELPAGARISLNNGITLKKGGSDE